jgi:tetratricopeptide (TPR) repeat protein
VTRTLHPAAALGLLALLVGAAFSGVLANGFAFDDREIVQNNPGLETLDPGDHLGKAFWEREGLTYRYYRPLTSWTLALNHALHGESAAGYHLANLLMHFGCAALLFLLLRRLGGYLPAFVAAAVFAVHPIQTEAVAWVVGRADLLATLFLLATLLFHAGLPEAPSARDLSRVLPAAAALGAALLSKEGALTFPAVLIAYELATALRREGRLRDRLRPAVRRLIFSAPFYLAVIGAYLVLRHQVVGTLLVTPDEALWKNPLLAAPLITRWLTAVNIAGRYLLLLVFPRTLSIDYYFDVVPLVRSVLAPAFLLPGLALVATGALGWAAARRIPAVLFGALAAPGTYLPLSHLLFAAPVVMAERVLYLPMIGLASCVGALLVAAGSRVIPERGRLAVPLFLVLVLLLPMVLRSRARTRDWKDDLTLFTSAVQAQPRSALAWNNLASQQLQLDDAPAAEASARRALEIVPDYLAARGNLADALRRQGRLDETERVLRQALQDSPQAEEALWLNLAQLITMRAGRLAAAGQTEAARPLQIEAIQQARTRLTRVGGRRPRAIYQLVLAQNLWGLGRNEEAGTAFVAALVATEAAGQPDASLFEVRITVHDATAAWHHQQGRVEHAAREWLNAAATAEAVGSTSRAAEFLLRAARMRLALDQRGEALVLVQEAQGLARNDPVISRQVRAALQALQAPGE